MSGYTKNTKNNQGGMTSKANSGVLAHECDTPYLLQVTNSIPLVCRNKRLYRLVLICLVFSACKIAITEVINVYALKILAAY